MNRGVSIAKINEKTINEDSFYSSDGCIAVSDGAGGCGLFADKWSKYLIDKLPKEQPIASFSDFDTWIDGIWEPFYDEYEELAKEGDGIFLNKYYSVGSCATIAVAWIVDAKKCRWLAYGDSVVFHYNRKTGNLEHSFTRLADFSNPPLLVSSKDPLEEMGFRCGEFRIDEDSVVFVASDALSHYIIMMYELSRCNEFSEELMDERNKQSGNSQLLSVAEKKVSTDFRTGVLVPLLQSTASEEQFEQYMRKLNDDGILDIDDYTLVLWTYGVDF